MRIAARLFAKVVLVQRLLPAAVVFVALLASACGSDKSSEASSTTEWANGVCSAITTWTDSIKSAGDSLKGGNLSKDSLQSAADDVKSATDTLDSDLKGLGKPDTQSGQEAKDSLDQLSSDLKAGTDSIATTVNDASSISELLGAAATVGTTIGTMGNQVSSAFKSLDELDPKGELQTAFEQASSCKELSSTS